MWPTIPINSLEEFEFNIRMLNRFTSPSKPTVCFRGQAVSSWGLVPSLPRMIPEYFQNYQISALELESIRSLQKRAHLLINPLVLPPEDRIVDWLTIMQHYNAPTRLLDWTYSPYVALYFAVQDRLTDEGAVWFFDWNWFAEYAASIFREDYYWAVKNFETMEKVTEWTTLSEFANPNILLHYDDFRIVKTPRVGTERLMVQQGTFTISKNLRTDHAEAIDFVFSKAFRAFGQPKTDDNARFNYSKITINPKAKRLILRKLNEMNINANSLFPGIDGLGRSIAGLVNISSEFFEPANSKTTFIIDDTNPEKVPEV